MNGTRALPVVVMFIVLLLLCGNPLVAGRADKAGTAAAAELLIPVGAATIGSGTSDLAGVSGIDAMYWNPAGTARLPFTYTAEFSHMNYFADIGVEYFALATKVEDVATFGFNAKMLSIGQIPITTSDQPDGTGETTSPTFVTLGGMFSRMITDKISFGVVANYIIEKMDKVSATDVAFTAGLQYTALGGVDGLSMGVVVRNIGPTMQFSGDGLSYTGELNDVLMPPSRYSVDATSDALPSTIEFGLQYDTPLMSDAVAHWSAAFQNNNYSADDYKAGVDIVYQNQFFLRGGYVISGEDNADYLFGSTFGVGMKTVIENIDIQFDYCYRSMKTFSSSHIITITMGLN